MNTIENLKVLKTLGPVFRSFESRYVIGTIPPEVFYKHTVFCAEQIGDVIEIVAYRLSEEDQENQKILLQD